MLAFMNKQARPGQAWPRLSESYGKMDKATF